MATGTVKWFNSTKGFGFIQPDGGGQDVFVHISAVERAGLSTLVDGQKINYEIQQDRRTGKSSAGISAKQVDCFSHEALTLPTRLEPLRSDRLPCASNNRSLTGLSVRFVARPSRGGCRGSAATPILHLLIKIRTSVWCQVH